MTTIPLDRQLLDWAKHRRRKAAAKCHLRLDLQSFLPRFAIVDTARHDDAKRARELCAEVKGGEIVLFDKAYVDFEHLAGFVERGSLLGDAGQGKPQLSRWCGSCQREPSAKILRDDVIELANARFPRAYPEVMRRVVALVEVDGEEREMTFLTNNLAGAPRSIVADLYRCRWQIEVFFKQIKQTLQLADFLGTNANAVRWQVWTALLFICSCAIWRSSPTGAIASPGSSP